MRNLFYIPDRQLREVALAAPAIRPGTELWTDLLVGRGVPYTAITVTHSLPHGIVVEPLYLGDEFRLGAAYR